MASAETEAQELIGAARSRRQKVLAELEREAAALQQRLDIIDRSQSHLLRAYDVVERTLLEARTALTPERQSGPIAPAPEPERLDHRPASDAANGTSHGSGLGRLAGREAEGPDPDDLPRPAALRVYDWSPTASRAG
jgi:hypothetical protein